MAKKLAAVVMVPHPHTGVVETFYPGDAPPAWAAKRITNPGAWGEETSTSSPQRASAQKEPADPPKDPDGSEPSGSGGEQPPAAPDGGEPNEGEGGEPPADPEGAKPDKGAVERPPASGPGSDKGAWRAYAEHLGITVDEGASRADIQAAVEAHEAQ